MNNLRNLRRAAGMTLKELAAEVGVSESAIAQIETGKRNPSFELLLKLGEALDCSVDMLINERKTPPLKSDEVQNIQSNKREELNRLLSRLTEDEIEKLLAEVKEIILGP